MKKSLQVLSTDSKLIVKFPPRTRAILFHVFILSLLLIMTLASIIVLFVDSELFLEYGFWGIMFLCIVSMPICIFSFFMLYKRNLTIDKNTNMLSYFSYFYRNVNLHAITIVKPMHNVNAIGFAIDEYFLEIMFSNNSATKYLKIKTQSNAQSEELKSIIEELMKKHPIA